MALNRFVADLLASRDRNVYYWYYATQLLHNLGGPAWDAWNKRSAKASSACRPRAAAATEEAGTLSVPSPDRWGAVAGRLYVTSLSLLTLEVYYRYLPLYREGDSRPFDSAPEMTSKTERSPHRQPRLTARVLTTRPDTCRTHGVNWSMKHRSCRPPSGPSTSESGIACVAAR